MGMQLWCCVCTSLDVAAGVRGVGGDCIALHAYGDIYREMLNIMERVYTASC